MKAAIISHNGKAFKWEYRSKYNLLRWLAASYGDNYSVISWK